jgi:Zn-dependent protease
MLELNIIQKISIWALPVLFAITGHEAAHGWVASKFGDQTARLAGRLTLNPLKHIDLVGTILVPAFMLIFSSFIFGWAKPVPVDQRNLRNPRRDMAIVSAAGSIANLLMAIFWAGIAKIGFLLYASGISEPLILMGKAGIAINVVLGVLNCLPIPPLDGARVLSNLLPGKAAWYFHQIEPYGFLILVLLLISGLLGYIMGPLIFFIMRWITLLFGL